MYIVDRTDRAIQKGQIGIGSTQRRWASFSLGQQVSFIPYDIHSEGVDVYLGTLKLEIDFFKKSNRLPDEFKEEDIGQAFIIVSLNRRMCVLGLTFLFYRTLRDKSLLSVKY